MEAMAVRKTEGLPPDLPPASSDLVPFNIRLPRGLIAALDARVEEINRQRRWTKINRSDLIRELLMRGVDEQPDTSVLAEAQREVEATGLPKPKRTRRS